MKKILLLVMSSAILLMGGFILFKQPWQKGYPMEKGTPSSKSSDDAHKEHLIPQLSMNTNLEIRAENDEAITSDVEYIKIYNSIKGGTEEERTALATDAYKGGYRHNPDVDLPIVIQSNVSRRTGMPLIKILPVKLYRKYETDEEAVAVFEENLKQREQSYERIEPAIDMISVQEAVAAAMKACSVEFDSEQKPKVILIREDLKDASP